MSRTEHYRIRLRTLDDWDEFLLAESGLPGPRGNIELAQAVAEEGDRQLFDRYLALNAEKAPTNSPYEFLAFCGALGLGRLLAEGERGLLGELRRHASDSRWRMREAVAMALQRLGVVDMQALVAEMRVWAKGAFLEQRAAAAALAEPRLLRSESDARAALDVLDTITASVERSVCRGSDDFAALRKGLGYCWSVCVAADPDAGKPLMEKWFAADDRDVRWIMRENLRKKRLERIEYEWVSEWRDHLG